MEKEEKTDFGYKRPAYLTREIPANCPNQALCQRLRDSNLEMPPIPAYSDLMTDAQTFRKPDQKYQDCWESQDDEYVCFMRTEGRRLWMAYQAPRS